MDISRDSIYSTYCTYHYIMLNINPFVLSPLTNLHRHNAFGSCCAAFHIHPQAWHMYNNGHKHRDLVLHPLCFCQFILLLTSFPYFHLGLPRKPPLDSRQHYHRWGGRLFTALLIITVVNPSRLVCLDYKSACLSGTHKIRK